MEALVRRIGGKTQKYVIYKEAEATAAGIPFKPWREASPGEWALTDDGWVGELLSVKEYVDSYRKTRLFKKFSFAVIFQTKNNRLLYEPRRLFKNFSSTKAQSWDDIEARRTRTKVTVQAYVKQMLAGKIDWDILGKMYRPKQEAPEKTVRRLFKSERIQKMVSEELDKVLQDEGIDKKYVLKLIKGAIDMARELNKPGVLLDAAKELGEIVQIKPKQKLLPGDFEAGIDFNLIERMEQAKKELKEAPKEIEHEVLAGDSEDTSSSGAVGAV